MGGLAGTLYAVLPGWLSYAAIAVMDGIFGGGRGRLARIDVVAIIRVSLVRLRFVVVVLLLRVGE